MFVLYICTKQKIKSMAIKSNKVKGKKQPVPFIPVHNSHIRELVENLPHSVYGRLKGILNQNGEQYTSHMITKILNGRIRASLDFIKQISVICGVSALSIVEASKIEYLTRAEERILSAFDSEKENDAGF